MEMATLPQTDRAPAHLHRELHARALRYALWLALFEAQQLRMNGLETRLLVELDRLAQWDLR